MLAVVSRSKGVEKTGDHELSDPDDWRNTEIPFGAYSTVSHR